VNSAERETLAQRVLSFSNATQTEVMVAASAGELTRFTRNAVHQNVADADVSVKVRALVGQRTGVASTNVLDDAALRDVVERAAEMARLAPEDPDQPQLPGPQRTEPPEGAYVEQTAHATPRLRAEMANAMFKTAEHHDYWCSGFVTTSSAGITIVNSSGACSSFDGTDAGVNVKMNASDSSGFGEGYHTDLTALDAHAIAATSAAKAKSSANPKTVEPGSWTVILEPAAFGELFSYLTDHFSAQSYEEGSSFLSDGLEEPYFNAGVTIHDDFAHPLNPGMPFDYEGHPTQRLALIENGIARNFVTDSYYAKKLGRENTGHALPAPNAYGPQALHMVISPGSKSINELISQTKRGLLVTRFWYIRTVDQKKAIVTGMTRDGTFLIEDGELAGGVRNMRFNQSILDALRNCELSNALHRTGGYSYSLVAPAAKIDDFRFTSGTDF